MQSFYNAINKLSDVKRELTGVMLAQNLASAQIATLTTSLTSLSNSSQEDIYILNYINSIIINVIVQIVDALTIVINVLLLVITDLFEIGFPLINMIINVLLQIFGPPTEPNIVGNSASIVNNTGVDVINVIDGSSNDAPPPPAGDMTDGMGDFTLAEESSNNGMQSEQMVALSTKLHKIAMKLSGSAAPLDDDSTTVRDIPTSVLKIGSSLDLRASELSGMMGDLKANMAIITEKLSSMSKEKKTE
jgi:hypothetical protein